MSRRPLTAAERARQKRQRTIAAVVAALVGSILLFTLVLVLASSEEVKSNLGDDVFTAGDSEPLAARVRREGPILYPDAVRRSRDIFVQHLGGERWTAFDARRPGTSRECTLRWDRSDREFRDPCTDATVPADGGDLTHYETEVDDDGKVVVNLQKPSRPPAASP